ncbi:LTA synthase family protein, partial [uncultured Ruthenibacterium sp.]|uniref:LTA synthase family protein n=1 Tax=uncultured Ruthenibacterium sp. TaxID=1905347 RepID=UPI00349EA5C9
GLQKGTCCEMVLSCDGSQGYRLIFGSVGGAKEITRWVQNGEVQPGVPEIRFYNLNQVRMTNFVFYGALLVLAAAALLVPVRLNGKWTRLAYHIAVIGLTACLAEYVLESCNATGLTALPKVSLLLNVLLIGSAGLLLYVISRRCQIAVLAMDLFFLGLAAVNYYTRMFRGTVLTAQDVFAAGTAMRVMSSYQFTLGWEICILLAAAILTLVLAWREPPAIEKREYRVFRAVIGMLCVVVYGAAMFPPVYTRLGMDDHTFLLERASKTNGYWETILINLNNPLFEKPDGYSDDAVRQLASQYPADPGEQTPNIVVVMVESLADFSRLGDVPAEEDALPFLHSLEGRDDVYKGELVVPVFGGGTVNTEFEALTGCSSASMPGLVNPYSQLIEEKEVAAMPSWLEQCGYSSWALHLEKAANWNRNDAYPFMGLENFTDISQVDTSTLTTVRSDETSEYMRASDASHYAQIEQNFETRSAQPYFSFSVTMQNHGGYLAPGFDSPVKLDEGKNYPLAEQYLGLAWYSDDAFRQFLEYWEQVDEPTMIVMFGDHFPNVEKEFFDEVLGTDRDQLAGQARLLVQTTPVVIWANYDVDYSVLPACFSANYLSAAVLHTAGAPMNSFQQYLFSQMQQMPVYSRYGFVDAQGVYYETLAGTPYESMSRDYELWQYGALERAQELSDVFFLDESAS